MELAAHLTPAPHLKATCPSDASPPHQVAREEPAAHVTPAIHTTVPLKIWQPI